MGDTTVNPVIPGLTRADDTNGDGTPDSTNTVRHTVDRFNGITSVTTDANPSVAYILDANGNVVFDGEWVYQYDAWNRLIAINDPGTLDPTDFVATAGANLGRIAPDTNDNPIHIIGQVRYRFRYDGLGRLIEREQYTVSPPPTPAVYKTLHYYYDGVRIVQEVVETPSGTTGQPATFHTEREYVYGPDYVDEFIAQVDDPAAETPPLPSYMLQDANFNVMALVNLPTTGGPQVLSQYQYEPYGPVAAADNGPGVNDDTENTVGHQGLFFHRLNTGVPSLSPQATGLYYNRNRWYAPHLGRFLTRDPRGEGASSIVPIISSGHVACGYPGHFETSQRFFSGMSVYLYQLANPFIGEMASITSKVNRSGQMTIMDEVTVLEDLYHLTGDVFSASYGWEYWRESVGQ